MIADKYISDSENGRPCDQLRRKALNCPADPAAHAFGSGHRQAPLSWISAAFAAMFGVAAVSGGRGRVQGKGAIELGLWPTASVRVAQLVHRRRRSPARCCFRRRGVFSAEQPQPLTNYDLDKCISAGREAGGSHRPWIATSGAIGSACRRRRRWRKFWGLKTDIPANRLGDQKKLVGNEEGAQPRRPSGRPRSLPGDV